MPNKFSVVLYPGTDRLIISEKTLTTELLNLKSVINGKGFEYNKSLFILSKIQINLMRVSNFNIFKM